MTPTLHPNPVQGGLNQRKDFTDTLLGTSTTSSQPPYHNRSFRSTVPGDTCAHVMRDTVPRGPFRPVSEKKI